MFILLILLLFTLRWQLIKVNQGFVSLVESTATCFLGWTLTTEIQMSLTIIRFLVKIQYVDQENLISKNTPFLPSEIFRQKLCSYDWNKIYRLLHFMDTWRLLQNKVVSKSAYIPWLQFSPFETIVETIRRSTTHGITWDNT